jgi:uncharacterized linocin/CFP29 family protein
MPNNPQVPWTDEQWARVNQVVQEEARRARVAATFLPLYGPLPADTDFVRQESVPGGDGRLRILDREILQLATLEVQVELRSAQMADPELESALTLFRRAANIIARLEDAVVFRGTIEDIIPGAGQRRIVPRGSAGGAFANVWRIHGGQIADGLWGADGAQPVAVPEPDADDDESLGDILVAKVSEAIGDVEKAFHLGPFALVLDPKFFLAAQTPSPSLVQPQDRILPFLGGGPLLRSSTLEDNTGVLVALGGAPVELVVAQDLEIQFLQVTPDPLYLFRLREKIALRIKEPEAIANLSLAEQEEAGTVPSRRRSRRGSREG